MLVGARGAATLRTAPSGFKQVRLWTAHWPGSRRALDALWKRLRPEPARQGEASVPRARNRQLREP
eukprot:7018797-Alexandrium_andersonii.AAC.1